MIKTLIFTNSIKPTQFIVKSIDSEFVGSYESFGSWRFCPFLYTFCTVILILLIWFLVTQNHILFIFDYTKVLIDLIYFQLFQDLHLSVTFQFDCSLIVLVINYGLL